MYVVYWCRSKTRDEVEELMLNTVKIVVWHIMSQSVTPCNGNAPSPEKNPGSAPVPAYKSLLENALQNNYMFFLCASDSNKNYRKRQKVQTEKDHQQIAVVILLRVQQKGSSQVLNYFHLPTINFFLSIFQGTQFKLFLLLIAVFCLSGCNR